MHIQLQTALDIHRLNRRFDAARYLNAKSALLNTYFKQSGIRGCIVGVSGGIDSAVTLGIIAHAAKQPGSPVQKIVSALLPIYAEGATHQAEASSRGAEVAASLGVEAITIDLSSSVGAAREASLAGTGTKGQPWSSGQLVSYMRTPMLYYQAALLAEKGIRSVVCGTTNRDEGSYIGFFGKASDGMVDIQPISDLHKSEVYQVAQLLPLPKSVCDAVPTGDTYDGACDEEMIGTSYDAVELYEWYLCLGTNEKESWSRSLCAEASEEFSTYRKKLEKLHLTNLHKYIGDSPAIHLDILDRAVPRGWRSQNILKLAHSSREVALAARVGPLELHKDFKDLIQTNAFNQIPQKQSLTDFGDSAVLIRKLLESKECESLIDQVRGASWIPADQHGKPIQDSHGATVRSYRATAFDEEVAQVLWSRIRLALPGVRTFTELTSTDWNGHPVWRPVGVNPMLRFIRYEKDGYLVPHFDAGYDYKDDQRYTLMSVVVTLTPRSHTKGGNTRLLINPQRHLPVDERSFEDSSHMALPRDVLVNVDAERGDALVFDHRLRHDAGTWEATSSRIILRTDIIFEKCGSNAIHSIESSAETLDEPQSWGFDPTYRKAYKSLGSTAALELAGYFWEPPHQQRQNLSVDPRWWTAPYEKILQRLSKLNESDASRELVVLVTSGSFCPIHSGHIEMMEQAKNELESQGRLVLGGYFAPDHDDYVQHKTGLTRVSFFDRIDLCELAVSESDWLRVDRWASLYAHTAVNFTTVVDRLQNWVNFHIATHRPIQVAYVFGSDNARFARTFVERGLCVCVPRPGYGNELDELELYQKTHNFGRMIICRNPSITLSSSKVRGGDLAGLQDSVRAKWLQLEQASRSSEGTMPVRGGHPKFYMRHEGSWATKFWAGLPGVDESQIRKAYLSFCEGLRNAFDKIFRSAQQDKNDPPINIVSLDLEDQTVAFENFSQRKHVVSLDPCLPGSSNMQISRCYELVSSRFLGFVARPGADPIHHQVEKIPEGSIVLFDDDVISGETATYTQNLLRPRCTVENFVTLSEDYSLQTLEQSKDNKSRIDLVDCRDFLVGSQEGGLVIRLPNGSVCRAPYLLPYVSPHRRASVPAVKEAAFSSAVWKLNKGFFSSLSVRLRVSDMSEAYQILCANQGFDKTLPMEDLCDWHYEQLAWCLDTKQKFEACQ